MSEDMSEMINNVKKMMDSGNMPDNIKEMLGNFNGFNYKPSNNNNQSNFLEKNSDKTTLNNNFDIETILKMKSIIDNMNKKNDPRANLLYSLKPYLRESRKSKLDQYVNFLNMTKIASIMTNDKKENNRNGNKQ